MSWADQLVKGTHQRFSVVVLDSAGKQVPSAPVSWKASPSSVARVDSKGQVTGVATGVAALTVTSGKLTASTALAVKPAKSSDVAVIKPSVSVLSLTKGALAPLTFTAIDTLGRTMATCTWSIASEDSHVASIIDGVVSALKIGLTAIAASCGGQDVAVPVAVIAPAPTAPTAPTVATLTVVPDSLALLVAASKALVVTGTTATGTPVDSPPLAFASSLSSVATVSSSGLVTGVAPGRATITVSSGSVNVAVPVTVTGGTVSTSRTFYVSPNGTASGDGSTLRPWSLAAALEQPAILQPGDTILLRGGTYAGPFTSRLTGSAQAPIVVRQAPGERAIIDGRFQVEGSYATYWGFEVLSSEPGRISAIAGSDAPDLPRSTQIVVVLGRYIKLIHLTIHDLGGGIFANANAVGLELYGNLLYNNGWRAPDGGKGHNLYLQNAEPTMSVLDNVAFGAFAIGLQMYGSDVATLRYFQIEGNTIFESGAPLSDMPGNTGWNVLFYGGSGKFGSTTFRANNLYHRNAAIETLKLGNAGGGAGSDITFSDNIVQGSSRFNESLRYVVTGNRFTSGATLLSGQDALMGLRLVAGEPLSSNVWDGNRYALAPGGDQTPFVVTSPFEGNYSFAEWRAAMRYDLSTSSSMTTRFTGTTVIVRPSKYEPGRAFVTCWNWDRLGVVNVDLSAVLKPGDAYEIHHVYNVFGAPVVSGVYAGGSVAVPQPSIAPPVPTGYQAYGAPTPDFAVFLVRKR